MVDLAAPPRIFDDGSGAKLLRPENRVAFVAQIAATGATNSSPYGFSQAQADGIRAAVNAMLTALIAAGIMAAS